MTKQEIMELENEIANEEIFAAIEESEEVIGMENCGTSGQDIEYSFRPLTGFMVLNLLTVKTNKKGGRNMKSILLNAIETNKEGLQKEGLYEQFKKLAKNPEGIHSFATRNIYKFEDDLDEVENEKVYIELLKAYYTYKIISFEVTIANSKEEQINYVLDNMTYFNEKGISQQLIEAIENGKDYSKILSALPGHEFTTICQDLYLRSGKTEKEVLPVYADRLQRLLKNQ